MGFSYSSSLYSLIDLANLQKGEVCWTTLVEMTRTLTFLDCAHPECHRRRRPRRDPGLQVPRRRSEYSYFIGTTLS